MWGYSDGGGVQDRFKEEMVKNATKRIKESQANPSQRHSPSQLYERIKSRL